MRTPGAKNKPQCCLVRLGDLCNVLNPDTKIEVSIKFIQPIAAANNLTVYGLEKLESKLESSELPNNVEKIEFFVTEPKPA